MSKPFRWWLDLAASLGMAVASLCVVAFIGSTYFNRPRSAPLPTIPIPVEPFSFEGRPTKGSSNSPVVLVMFSDFECPFCRDFARKALPQFEKTWVDSGEIALVFVHYPLQQIHPRAVRAAEAAECAGSAGKFWQMHDALFAEPVRLADDDLVAAADSIRIDTTAFRTCMDGRMSASVQESMKIAGQLQLQGTPSFFIGRRLDEHRLKVSETFYGIRSTTALNGIAKRATGNAN